MKTTKSLLVFIIVSGVFVAVVAVILLRKSPVQEQNITTVYTSTPLSGTGSYSVTSSVIPVQRGALKDFEETANNYPASPYFRPYVTSVNAYFPEPINFTGGIYPPTEKIGILTDDMGTILNLYRKAIAPRQQLFEYFIQDKYNFFIPLRGTRYLEDGDIVDSVDGKVTPAGGWKVKIYVNDKYIYV